MSPGRLPTLTPTDVERVLKANGFVLKSSKGSHRKYVKGHRVVIVPFHARSGIPPGTLHNIIKASGLSRDDFS